ncbi:MAG: putative prephenate dehydrogenase [Elusimicrobia bacterium]|nr:MAG: putative prephenate dehydrogenase [Elusimicrobiota bacterium]
MKVGLVGFGRIGRLLTRYFSGDADILVYDTKLDARAVRALGARPATLAEACAADAVVLCVPMAAFEGAVRRIRTLVRPGAVVADVCSLKEHPVRVMKRLLPRGVHILATHPNFGPDSAAESLAGRKLVVWPVRLPRGLYARAKRAFAKKGLDVVELSPKDHDRRMASSLVLTHFIGRGLVAYGAKPTGVDTEGYKRLLRILETVQNDSWQLFKDMNRYNAYAAPMRRRLKRALAAVEARL